MLSVFPSVLVLGVAALVALFLTATPTSPPRIAPARSGAARALALTLTIQSAHFAEEAATGFPGRLGALLGLPAMSSGFFLVFNLTWIGIWIVSVPGVRSATAAFFATWFLAVAGMFNAVAHPLLAIAAGGYFPGLGSSPFVGAADEWLWLRLHSATRPVPVTG